MNGQFGDALESDRAVDWLVSQSLYPGQLSGREESRDTSLPAVDERFPELFEEGVAGEQIQGGDLSGYEFASVDSSEPNDGLEPERDRGERSGGGRVLRIRKPRFLIARESRRFVVCVGVGLVLGAVAMIVIAPFSKAPDRHLPPVLRVIRTSRRVATPKPREKLRSGCVIAPQKKKREKSRGRSRPVRSPQERAPKPKLPLPSGSVGVIHPRVVVPHGVSRSFPPSSVPVGNFSENDDNPIDDWQ